MKIKELDIDGWQKLVNQYRAAHPNAKPGAAMDNLEKNLLDVLTRLRFWDDDASVFTKSTAKVWGPSPYLAIAIKTQAELFAEVANGQ